METGSGKKGTGSGGLSGRVESHRLGVRLAGGQLGQLLQPLLQLQRELLVTLLTHGLHVKLHKLVPGEHTVPSGARPPPCPASEPRLCCLAEVPPHHSYPRASTPASLPARPDSGLPFTADGPPGCHSRFRHCRRLLSAPPSSETLRVSGALPPNLPASLSTSRLSHPADPGCPLGLRICSGFGGAQCAGGCVMGSKPRTPGWDRRREARAGAHSLQRELAVAGGAGEAVHTPGLVEGRHHCEGQMQPH